MKIILLVTFLLSIFWSPSWSEVIDLNLDCKFDLVTTCGIWGNKETKSNCELTTHTHSLVNTKYQDGALNIKFDGDRNYEITSNILSIGESNLFISKLENHFISERKYIFQGKRIWKKTLKHTENIELNFNRFTGKLSSYTNSLIQDSWSIEFFHCKVRKQKF